MRRREYLAGVTVGLSAVAGCSRMLGTDGTDGSDETGDGPETNDSGNEAPTDAGTSTVPADVGGQYVGLQGGPRHRGAVDGSLDGALEAAWQYGAGADVSERRVGTPAVVDGTVYVPEGTVSGETLTGYLTALDAATGSTDWQYEFPEQHFVDGAVYVDGTVLVRFARTLVAVDASSGEEQWRLEETMATPAAADGRVFVPAEAKGGVALHAVDVGSGEIHWTADLARGRTTPAVADGLVYVADDRVVGYDVDAGSAEWTATVDEVPGTAPTVTDDRLYVGTLGNGIAAVDRAAGEQVWWTEVPTQGASSGPVAPTSPAVDGSALFTTSLFSVASLSIGSGDVRWSREVDANGPPVMTDDAVYVGDVSGLVAVEKAAPNDAPGFEQRNEAGAAPAIVDGAAFYPADRLYALV